MSVYQITKSLLYYCTFKHQSFFIKFVMFVRDEHKRQYSSSLLWFASNTRHMAQAITKMQLLNAMK